MVDRGTLEDIIGSLKSAPWDGRVFRVMLGEYPPDRENNQGARWNPPDVAAIYTSRKCHTCIAEVEYHLARQSRPVRADLKKTLYEINVSLGAVVTLDDAIERLEAIGIDRPRLFSDDMKLSQEVGRLITWLGHDGLLVPSARADGENLVIYPGRTTDSYRFDVLGQTPL